MDWLVKPCFGCPSFALDSVEDYSCWQLTLDGSIWWYNLWSMESLSKIHVADSTAATFISVGLLPCRSWHDARSQQWLGHHWQHLALESRSLRPQFRSALGRRRQFYESADEQCQVHWFQCHWTVSWGEWSCETRLAAIHCCGQHKSRL